jgi:hypothetical protein
VLGKRRIANIVSEPLVMFGFASTFPISWVFAFKFCEYAWP